MKLLVGLGNPGEQYARTRHNLGRDLLVAVTSHYLLPPGGKRFQGIFGEGRIGPERIFWLLPETYMNLSGESVGAAVRYYRIEPGQVIVFHDDVDLAFGKVRMKPGGGNGGHNGLKSIQQVLGTADFVRIRLGVGRPPPGVDTARHVLAGFTPAEQEERERLLSIMPPVIPLILADDLAGAMNRLQPALRSAPTAS
ncbi:MAG: aminoacyl-tRNA hydrolase [Magnetococcales bacterium]|nr:aminoacyl-tRNA hydrolase [Magnetococcales bacterium]